MSTLEITRTDLIARLKAQLPRAKRYDAELLAAHRQAEKDHLKAWKAACREAAGWSYEEAKAHRFNLPKSPDGNHYWNEPECPIRKTVQIQAAIDRLNLDRRKSFRLSSDGQDRGLFHLATWDPDAEPEQAC